MVVIIMCDTSTGLRRKAPLKGKQDALTRDKDGNKRETRFILIGNVEALPRASKEEQEG